MFHRRGCGDADGLAQSWQTGFGGSLSRVNLFAEKP
jgi:hypothetical protein